MKLILATTMATTLAAARLMALLNQYPARERKD